MVKRNMATQKTDLPLLLPIKNLRFTIDSYIGYDYIDSGITDSMFVTSSESIK